jgi:hypothetical protein
VCLSVCSKTKLSCEKFVIGYEMRLNVVSVGSFDMLLNLLIGAVGFSTEVERVDKESGAQLIQVEVP